MSPGPIEEGAKVATSLIDTMKANPLALAVLVFNLVMIGLVYVATGEFRTQNKDVMTELLSQHKIMVDLLSRCIVPGDDVKPTL